MRQTETLRLYLDEARMRKMTATPVRVARTVIFHALAVASIFWTSTLYGQTNGGEKLESEPRDVVEELASPDSVIALRAEDEILRIGPTMIEQLKSSTDENLDKKLRIQKLIRRLQLQQVDETIQTLEAGGMTSPVQIEIQHSKSPIQVTTNDQNARQRLECTLKLVCEKTVIPLHLNVNFPDFRVTRSAGLKRSAIITSATKLPLQTQQVAVPFSILLPHDFAPSETLHLQGTASLTCLMNCETIELSATEGPSDSRFVGEAEARLLSCDTTSRLPSADLEILFAPSVKWESYEVERLLESIRFQHKSAPPRVPSRVEVISQSYDLVTVRIFLKDAAFEDSILDPLNLKFLIDLPAKHVEFNIPIQAEIHL